MGSTIVQTNIEMNQAKFRSLVIKKIMYLTPQNSGIGREVQFCAVSIIDKYLLAWERRGKPILMIKKAVIPVAIVSIVLANKYVRKTYIKIQKLGSLLSWQYPVDNLKDLVLEIEPEILRGIDFCIPFQTPFTALERCMVKHQTLHDQLCMILKIVICGVHYSTELSQCPEKVGRIFEKISLKKKDKTISQYMRKVLQEYKKMKAQDLRNPPER